MKIKAVAIKVRKSVITAECVGRGVVGERVLVCERLATYRGRAIGVGIITEVLQKSSIVRFNPLPEPFEIACYMNMPTIVEVPDNLPDPPDLINTEELLPVAVSIQSINTCQRCGSISESLICPSCKQLLLTEKVNALVNALRTHSPTDLLKENPPIVVSAALIVKECNLPAADAVKLAEHLGLEKTIKLLKEIEPQSPDDRKLIAVEILLSHEGTLQSLTEIPDVRLKKLIKQFGRTEYMPITFTDMETEMELRGIESPDLRGIINLTEPFSELPDADNDDDINTLKLLLRDLFLRFIAPDMKLKADPNFYKVALLQTLRLARDIINEWLADIDGFGR